MQNILLDLTMSGQQESSQIILHKPIPASLAVPPFTCQVTLSTTSAEGSTMAIAAIQDANTTTSASDNSLLCLVVAATTIIDKN